MKKSTNRIETSPFNLIQKEKHYLQHVERLARIAVDRKLNQESQKTLDQHHRRLQRSQDALRRKKTQQLLEIQKDNDRILERLLRINCGTDKRQVPGGSQMKVQNHMPELNRSPFENGKIKSLNRVSRKQDIIRIVNENVKLTEKIVFQESSLSKSKMERDYQNHQAISHRIRKVKLHDDRTCQIGHSIKLSQDMRIKSHLPYLSALPSASLQVSQNFSSSRTTSVPKFRTELKSLTSRSPMKPLIVPHDSRSSGYRSKTSERSKSMTTMKPNLSNVASVEERFHVPQIEINFFESEKDSQNECENLGDVDPGQEIEQEREQEQEQEEKIEQEREQEEIMMEEENNIEKEPELLLHETDEEKDKGEEEEEEEEEEERLNVCQEESQVKEIENNRKEEKEESKLKTDEEEQEEKQEEQENEENISGQEQKEERDESVDEQEKKSLEKEEEELFQEEELDDDHNEIDEEENNSEEEGRERRQEDVDDFEVLENSSLNQRKPMLPVKVFPAKMDFIKEESLAQEESRKVSAMESYAENSKDSSYISKKFQGL